MIYNDRINTFKRLKEIDAVIDDKPTKALIKELALTRIQNLDCFRELKSLNDNGNFRYIHPLIKHHSLRAKLEKTLAGNPGEYLDGYQRAKENVKRYTSFIKSKKRSAEQKKLDAESLKKWQEECEVYKNILEKKNDK